MAEQWRWGWCWVGPGARGRSPKTSLADLLAVSVHQHGSVSLSQTPAITSQHSSRAQNARSLLPCPYKEAVQWNSATVIMERCSSNLHPAQSPGWKACSRCSTKVLRREWPIQPQHWPNWVKIYIDIFIIDCEGMCFVNTMILKYLCLLIKSFWSEQNDLLSNTCRGAYVENTPVHLWTLLWGSWLRSDYFVRDFVADSVSPVAIFSIYEYLIRVGGRKYLQGVINPRWFVHFPGGL